MKRKKTKDEEYDYVTLDGDDVVVNYFPTFEEFKKMEKEKKEKEKM